MREARRGRVRQWSGDDYQDSTMGLVELVRAMPYLLAFEIIPPLHVLNAVLKTGVAEAGMSGRCEWRPFRVSATEFRTFVKDMEGLNESFRYIEPPRGIKSFDDWNCWKTCHVIGIPLAPCLKLSRKVVEWSEKELAAGKKGDIDAAAKANEKVTYWFDKQFQLMQPYIAAYRRNRDGR